MTPYPNYLVSAFAHPNEVYEIKDIAQQPKGSTLKLDDEEWDLTCECNKYALSINDARKFWRGR